MKKLSEMSISEMLATAQDGMNLFIEESEDKPIVNTKTQDSWEESKHPRDNDGKFTEKGSGSISSPKSEQVKAEISESDNTTMQNKEKALNAIKADENFKTMEKALNNPVKIESDFNGEEYTPLEFYDYFNYHEKSKNKINREIEDEIERRINNEEYRRRNILEGEDTEAKKELIENEFAPEGIEEDIERYNDDNGTELTEEEFLNLKDELIKFYSDSIFGRYEYEEIEKDVKADYEEEEMECSDIVRQNIIKPIENYIKTLLPKYGYNYETTERSYTESTYIKFTTPEKLTIKDSDEDDDERDIFTIRLSLHGDRYDDVGRISINLRDKPENIAEKINIFLSKPNKDYRHDKIYYGAYDSIYSFLGNLKQNSEDKPMKKDLKTNGGSGQDTAPGQEEIKMSDEKIAKILEVLGIAEEEKAEKAAKIKEVLAETNPSATGADDTDPAEEADPVKSTIPGGIQDPVASDPEAEEKKRAEAMDKAIAEHVAKLEAKNELVAQLKPVIGAFDSGKMTINEVAKYACDKLNVPCGNNDALSMLKGFLLGRKQEVLLQPSTAAQDTALDGEDEAFKNYLEGK